MVTASGSASSSRAVALVPVPEPEPAEPDGGAAAVSSLPSASEAWWAADWVIWEASEEPRLPRPGLVSTVRVGRSVARPVVSAATSAVNACGTSSAP